MAEITRRDFLKTAGLATLASLASLSGLGCSSKGLIGDGLTKEERQKVAKTTKTLYDNGLMPSYSMNNDGYVIDATFRWKNKKELLDDIAKKRTIPNLVESEKNRLEYMQKVAIPLYNAMELRKMTPENVSPRQILEITNQNY